MSKREAILAAAVTALSGTVNVGSRIYRSRVEPLSRGESPAIVVEPISDICTQDTLNTFEWILTFKVSVIVRGNVPDQLADPIITDVHSKLKSNSTLAGLVVNLIPTNVTFELIEADQPAGIISAEYSAQYRTSLNSISS